VSETDSVAWQVNCLQQQQLPQTSAQRELLIKRGGLLC
jgi:hypothetical protein